ncbi:hypothetical protein GCAAIG_08515 [Candidatus Electronema halotolerans]
MPRVNEQREEIFLQIGFNSSNADGSLKTIEVIGIPGEKLSNGKCVVSEKAQHFFDDLIVKPIFMKSRQMRSCDFRYLKIWAYNPDVKDSQRGYKVPSIDQNDLKIVSDTKSSGLRDIIILDNGLTGESYQRWKVICIELFSHLFRRFVAPPKPPEFEGRIGMKFIDTIFSGIDSMMTKSDKYGEMKRNLFFDTLIIQID